MIEHDTITVISFSKTVDDVDNINELPPKARAVLDSAERMESRGFQELNGYIGRKLAWSCGGYWTGRGNTPETRGKFHITSMGNGTMLFSK